MSTTVTCIPYYTLINKVKELGNYGVRAFLKECPDPAKVINALVPSRRSVMAFVAGKGDIEMMDTLVEFGGDLNIERTRPTKSKNTPLMVAIIEKQNHMITYLLKKGADPTLTNANGISPLLLAVRRHNRGIVELLLSYGADPNVQHAKLSFSPLNQAISSFREDIVSVLLKAGANPTAPDRDGFAPIHIACNCGMLAVVRSLVDRGAPIDVMTRMGYSSFYYACVSAMRKHYRSNFCKKGFDVREAIDFFMSNGYPVFRDISNPKYELLSEAFCGGTASLIIKQYLTDARLKRLLLNKVALKMSEENEKLIREVLIGGKRKQEPHGPDRHEKSSGVGKH